MIESSFKAYADEALSVEFISPAVANHIGNDSHRFMFYLGSNIAGRKMKPESDSTVKILPHTNNAERKPSTSYQVGQIVTVGQVAYVCTTAGTTSAGTVSYPTDIGDQVTDGTAVFLTVGKAHTAMDIRLADSLVGLDSATYGEPLDLGATVDSLVAKPVHVEAKNTSEGVYNTNMTALIAVHLNPCREYAE